MTVRVAAALPGPEPPPSPAAPGADRRGDRPVRFGDAPADTPVLGPGAAEQEGPAIFELPGATLVVPPGWRATADAETVVLER